jgi:hypothetical protein
MPVNIHSIGRRGDSADNPVQATTTALKELQVFPQKPHPQWGPADQRAFAQMGRGAWPEWRDDRGAE